MRKQQVTLIAILLSSGLLYRQVALPKDKSSNGTSAARAADNKPDDKKLAEEGPWSAFCEHGQVVASTTESEKWCTPTVPVKFILAAVPDPEQTHLSLDFDRYVESIAWAVADSNYSLETYWFPWQPRPEKEETEPSKRDAVLADRARRLKMPGVMLFHRSTAKGEEELLAVFLIGERPTFGVNRTALRTALEAVYAISPNMNDNFYLVGPSFSGSLPGLKSLLSDGRLWTELGHDGKGKPFTIISGQTTSTVELEKFKLDAPSNFHTTLNDDRYALDHLLAYLPARDGRGGPDVALLSEDETAYGNDLQAQENGTSAASQPSKAPKRVLMMRYPRGIARLRNAANEIPSTGAVAQPADLPLVLKETGEDVIRSFSPQQTPLSSEAVLINLAGTVRRNGIRYIGVFATDPLDTLFLVRFLRSACPDVQLVVFSSDLLFARVAHNWLIEGLLTVTTYPLFIENQNFANLSEPPRRVPFPSAYAEGVYNATRLVLVQLKTSTADKTMEYFSADGDAKLRPPLWLTILGHDGFWPVARLEGQKASLEPSAVVMRGLPAKGGANSLPNNPSLLWRTIFGVVGLHSIFVLLAVFIMNCCRGTKAERWLRSVNFTRNFSLHSTQNQEAARAVNLFIILATVGIMNAIFLTALPPGVSGWAKSFCSVVLILAVAESIWMTVILIKGQPAWDAVALLLFSWVFSIACGVSLGSMQANPGELRVLDFFAYRALHPESGVSPILPPLILAIGYHYWALIQLRRLRWLEERRPTTVTYPCVCCQPNRSQRHAGAGAHGDKAWFVQSPLPLKEEIESIFGRRTAVLTLPFTCLWVLLFWPPSHVNSIEPFSYRVFFAILLVVMYGMLVGNWIRFMVLWRDLLQALHFLESHPLREAFTRLPSDFSWTSIWIGTLRPQLITLTRSYDCFRTLANRGIDLLPSDEGSQLSVHLLTLEEKQQTGGDRYGAGYFEAYNAIEQSYACAAYEAAARLKGEWLEGSSDSISEHEKKLSPAALPIEVQTRWMMEEFLALRYVAYIRYVFQQMRNFLEFVTTAFILLAIATVAYPFQGHHSIATAHLILFLVLGAGVIVAFLRMDRDPLLSRLNGSQPNAVGLGFVWRVATYGSVPLLSLLGSQFPSIREFLFSWVQPALQAIK